MQHILHISKPIDIPDHQLDLVIGGLNARIAYA